jgi:cell wall assembly regulator SMI1
MRVGAVAEAWGLIEAAPRPRAAGTSPSLPAGASPDHLRRVEAELGVTLPADVRESYLLHDGSDGLWVCEQGFLMPLLAPGDGPLGSYGVLDLWRGMLQVGEAMAGERSCPVGPVRDDWWNRLWVPVTENECGDFVCVDLAPGPGGRRGQVIEWNHEQGATRVLAGSFGGWLASLAEPGAAANRASIG